jgi:hypothetical protein
MFRTRPNGAGDPKEEVHMNALRIFAAAAALSLAGSALPAHAAPAAQNQEHRDADRQNNSNSSNNHTDYSNNSYYQLGNREGYQDYGKKQQRKMHNHKYRNDDDRSAHDSGYQQGWSGQQGNRNNNRGQQQGNINENRNQQSNSNNNNRHVNDNRDPR